MYPIIRATVIGIILIPRFLYSQDSLLKESQRLIEYKQYDSATALYSHSIIPIISQWDSISTGRVFLIYHDMQWDLRNRDSAIQMNIAAFKFFVDSQFWTGHALKQRSKDLLLQGNYDAALADAQQASEIYSGLKDTLELASCLSAQSNIFHEIFQYKTGIAYGHQALDLLERHSKGNPDYLAYAMNCIAINHDDNDEHEEAIKWHKRIIDEVMPYVVHPANKTRTYNNIGNSYMKLGKYDEAIKYLLYNLELETKTGRKYGLATVKMNLGILSYLNKEFEKSKKYLDESEALAYEIMAAEKIHDVLYQQYKLYQYWGNYEKSLAYMERFHNFKDSLLNETKSKQWLELQAKYETSIKEREIADQKAELASKDLIIQQNKLLTLVLGGVVILLILLGFLIRARMKLRQQRELEAARAEIKEAQLEAAINSQEIERKRFARDLHDGFGQMISILNLNLSTLEKGNVDRDSVFENSSQVLDEMYKELKSICFNLMPETLIKNGVVDALREFAFRINQADKLIVRVSVFGIEDRLPDILEINLYRISQEWINNVIKYSDATTADLQITKDTTEVTLMIEDNGSGFDKTMLIKGKGNGWKNIQSRTNLMKGDVELDTIPGTRGNTLILNIPIEIAIEVPTA